MTGSDDIPDISDLDPYDEGDQMDVNEAAEAAWTADSTPFERVKSIISHTHEYQSATVIADRARVSTPTARKHLESLVRSGYVVAREGRPRGYTRNPDQRRFERIQQLADRYTQDELIVEIRQMKQRLADLHQEHDAASPSSLVSQLDADDEEGWQTVRTWRTTKRDLALAEAALAFMAARSVDGDGADTASISPSGIA
jgi:DNA-binding transcriptional regulator YhcF (GntR family)